MSLTGMWQRLKQWLTGEQPARPSYDVNARNDLARRAMYPELSDDEYNRRFHPNDAKGPR